MLALYPSDTKGSRIVDIWTEDGGFEYFYGNYALCPLLQQYESVKIHGVTRGLGTKISIL